MPAPLIPIDEQQNLLVDAFADAFAQPRSPVEALALAQSLGLDGVLRPEAQDGLGLGAFEAGLLAFEAGRLDAQLPLKEWLWSVAAAALAGGAALPAPGRSVTCTLPVAPPRIAGPATLRFFAVPLADCADVLTCVVRTGERPDARGIRVHYLPREGGAWRVLGRTSLVSGTSAFDIEVDAAALSEPVEAAGFALRSSDATWQRLEALWLILAGAELAGACEGGRDIGVEYLKTRQQFGRPIGAFQLLRKLAVDGWMAAEDLLLAWQRAALCWDRGATDAWMAAQACAAAAPAAREALESVIQMHGAMGFTAELGLHHRLNRAVLCEIGFGPRAPRLAAITQAWREAGGEEFAAVPANFLTPAHAA